LNNKKKFKNCKNKKQLFFDFFLPDFNCCIEYDGIQHFEIVEFFGGEKSFNERLINDNIKNDFCEENNISLLRISYKDNINEILEKIIIEI
jgi:very-short-patch-repair endonuclease